MTLRYLCVLVCVFSAVGCSVVQPQLPQKDSSVGIEMLEAQQAMMGQYAERLAELLESQESLSRDVEVLQLDVKRVNKLMAGELKAIRDFHQNFEAKSEAREKREVKQVVAPVKHTILGRYEWLWVDLLSDNIKARIDTGTASSSLSVSSIQPFERDGDSWVRFTVPEVDGEKVYETPVVRFTKVRFGDGEEDVKRRPVVKLTVRLGSLIEEAEFSLEEKKEVAYPVQLGRSFLRDIALVDVAKKFTQKKYTPPAVNAVALP